MYILDSEEIKRTDLKTIQTGIKEETLMEQAAFSIYQIIKDLNPKKVIAICGTGNNGGDALATIRLLKNFGIKADAYLNGTYEKCSLGMKKQIEIAKNYNVNFVGIESIGDYDIIIDGLIGNGLKGELREDTKILIDKLNNINCKKISVDIPSGICSDTGEIMGDAFKADITITFGYLKIGHIMYPAIDYIGNLKLVELSFFKERYTRKLVNEEQVKNFFPLRKENSNKFTYGKVCILAGSVQYPGASVLTALGAIKSGAGMVQLITPNRTESIINIEPSVIYRSLDKDYFEKEDLEIINKDLKAANTIIIGPGITKNSIEFVNEIIDNYTEKKIILDADALYAIKNKKLRKNILITPHPGEIKKFTDQKIKTVYEIEELSKNLNCNILYKNSTNIITDSQNTYFNVLGGSFLSKGGTGDLLSGLIGGFSAQGCNLMESSIISTYILYKTGRKLQEEYTSNYMTPILILNNIYKTIKELI
ncbi:MULTISPECIES: NAD(P)H-hydrate dehydratase [Oceanotoga]|uniref:Bifunctional NAD(P)H-hydrate repair enzyme n=1 Tax=Oceanotoga teriensis TaxID=515440 RepID=A0AA45C8N9_9BACT|nr:MULTISPECIES: NAD(P)H-hydrate dehydratase [Oceanotoga]MDN5343750.1 ADP-dependent NAD(P)H-hydrate dehydratase / NAD(P)H-hydrate epimerase [Oceanotoga sp.]MDO7975556.1 NAD(P)H-hydrate dehydratase [Oceanotoga teriensis]PWJ96155.1 NAD(P)H-hydrate epimerase [Oceanotoga teriensis]